MAKMSALKLFMVFVLVAMCCSLVIFSNPVSLRLFWSSISPTWIKLQIQIRKLSYWSPKYLFRSPIVRKLSKYNISRKISISQFEGKIWQNFSTNINLQQFWARTTENLWSTEKFPKVCWKFGRLSKKLRCI